VKVITPIDIILKDPKGKIFKTGSLRGGQVNATKWSMEDNILRFNARFAVYRDNPDVNSKIKKLKEPHDESVEILIEEILFLAIRGRVIFPTEEEEEQDVIDI